MDLYQKKPEICLSENTKLLEIGLEVRNRSMLVCWVCHKIQLKTSTCVRDFWAYFWHFSFVKRGKYKMSDCTR